MEPTTINRLTYYQAITCTKQNVNGVFVEHLSQAKAAHQSVTKFMATPKCVWSLQKLQLRMNFSSAEEPLYYNLRDVVHCTMVQFITLGSMHFGQKHLTYRN